MDALVSRELLHIYPEGDSLYVKALRTPNKATLNGETCLVDELNKYRLEEGDVISLYQVKYRYVAARVKEKDFAKSPQSSHSSPKAQAGAKVAPSSGERSRRESRKPSMMGKQTSKIAAAITPGNWGGQTLSWAFFAVFAGCAIAMVVIFAKGSSSESSDTGASDRMLRGALG
jgi:hypothetical protein